MNRLSSFSLFWCQLRSKLNPASHNSTGLDRNRIDRRGRNFKVVSRVGFPDVRSKWTAQRGGDLTRKCEAVVPVQQVNLSVFPLVLARLYINLFGSFAKTGSSWNGEMSIGAPLFQRPTIRAPRSSLPSAGVKGFLFPSSGRGFFIKKLLNPGTSWDSQRKTAKLPSVDQSFLMLKPGSPVLPVTITPGCTGLGPGGITVSNPVTRGLEIPSSKPKLGLRSVDIHIDGL